MPLIYCLTRWAWALGIPLGVSPEFLRASPQATAGYRSSSAITANTAAAVAYDVKVLFAAVARGGAGQSSASVRRFGPRLLPRLGEAKAGGPLPLIKGTVIRLVVEKLPSGGVNKPVSLW